MSTKQNQKILRMVELAMLTALIVVLQLIGGFLKVGPVNLSFVLVPIVIGAILLGPSGGAFLGGVFGLVVTVMSATGMDPTGVVLWGINPFLTALICMLKGIMAGLCSGLVYKAMPKKGIFGTALAAVCAPIVNTGLFIAGVALFFNDTLYEWAGGSNMLEFIITGLCGLNFLIEFCINLVLAPAMTTIINVISAKKNKI